MVRCFLAFAALVLAGAVAAAGAAVQSSTSFFESQGHKVSVECFAPADGQHAAVLLLHGRDGPGRGYSEYARWLAEQGFAVFLLHYYDRSGFPATVEQVRKSTPIWLSAISDAVSWAAKQPAVKPKLIGVLGFSQGAYLAVGAGLTDSRVRTVVEYFGGLPEVALDGIKHMPPTLILHGDADRIIPVGEAYTLQRLFSSAGVSYEIKIYKGAGHGFGPDDRADARNRTLAFLKRHLH